MTNILDNKSAILRRVHRIRGMITSMNERMNEAEAEAEDFIEGQVSWGLHTDLQDLEFKLAHYLAAPDSLYAKDEQAAVDNVLARVDPEGEPHFAV